MVRLSSSGRARSPPWAQTLPPGRFVSCQAGREPPTANEAPGASAWAHLGPHAAAKAFPPADGAIHVEHRPVGCRPPRACRGPAVASSNPAVPKGPLEGASAPRLSQPGRALPRNGDGDASGLERLFPEAHRIPSPDVVIEWMTGKDGLGRQSWFAPCPPDGQPGSAGCRGGA